MDKQLYKRIVTELAELGIKELGVFFFGESFLSSWLPEAISFAKDRGINYVFLTTNGSLASEDRISNCMEAKLDSLKFSINYADEKQFEEITGVGAKHFHQIKNNIKNAYRIRENNKHPCNLYASYIKYNGLQDEKMALIIEELRPYLDEVYSLPLYSQAANIDNKDWEISAGNRGRYGNLVNPLPCWTLFQAGHINFDGTLNACCFAVDDQFIMGDLNKQNFMDAWNSPQFRKLRKAHLDKDVSNTACEKCACKG